MFAYAVWRLSEASSTQKVMTPPTLTAAQVTERWKRLWVRGLFLTITGQGELEGMELNIMCKDILFRSWVIHDKHKY